MLVGEVTRSGGAVTERQVGTPEGEERREATGLGQAQTVLADLDRLAQVAVLEMDPEGDPSAERLAPQVPALLGQPSRLVAPAEGVLVVALDEVEP